MFFQWGIEQEAAIYLNASIVGLQARRSYVDSFVSGTSANLKIQRDISVSALKK